MYQKQSTQDANGDDSVPPEEKLRLIREDPVVCAAYFREVVLQLRKHLRSRVKGPMGRYFARDWFIWIEFQQRGSPHAHCLLWLNDGPDQPLDDLAKTAAFIDELLTCDSDHPFAARNRHNHTSTCFKNKFIRHRFVKKQLDAHEAHQGIIAIIKDYFEYCDYFTDYQRLPHGRTMIISSGLPLEAHHHCRFGAPFWPTHTTRIVMPLQADQDERTEIRDGSSWDSYIEYLRDLRLKLKDVLSAADCPGTLEEVWDAAGCPDDATYELAIRTVVRRPTVLYKRRVQDRWTNPYLRGVLEVFGANTDAQIVLDVYSLVRYCVSYVTKAEKNHSQLHNAITRLRREQGFDDCTLMKMLCSRTLRAKETSAQEAAWVLMKFPLCETSRKCRGGFGGGATGQVPPPGTQAPPKKGGKEDKEREKREKEREKKEKNVNANVKADDFELVAFNVYFSIVLQKRTIATVTSETVYSFNLYDVTACLGYPAPPPHIHSHISHKCKL
ncbi:Ferrochelatase [Frankliniella fusca]|uniref:Ferrochelatase n=1 Tax=Frankliniella fusca TaxID=407009 RepID=A0AAE1HSI0_9NEOP|nr:Ferrochelatase [Frankliniella fusca]